MAIAGTDVKDKAAPIAATERKAAFLCIGILPGRLESFSSLAFHDVAVHICRLPGAIPECGTTRCDASPAWLTAAPPLAAGMSGHRQVSEPAS
jgi:hypothetical protein